jgi:hypothetical protein
MVRNGKPDPHARQGRTSLFGDPALRPAVTKKARSVVALSRVARGERAAPVSPPAAGRGCKEAGSSLGGCPASCPDAHRPTHGHRHVRNWAIEQIVQSSPLSSLVMTIWWRGDVEITDFLFPAPASVATSGFFRHPHAPRNRTPRRCVGADPRTLVAARRDTGAVLRPGGCRPFRRDCRRRTMLSRSRRRNRACAIGSRGGTDIGTAATRGLTNRAPAMRPTLDGGRRSLRGVVNGAMGGACAPFV